MNVDDTTSRGGVPYDRGTMLMPPPDHHASQAAAAAAVFAATLLTSAAIMLIAASFVLSAAAFVVWFRNRENLRALDELLREKAHAGMAVLKETKGA